VGKAQLGTRTDWARHRKDRERETGGFYEVAKNRKKVDSEKLLKCSM